MCIDGFNKAGLLNASPTSLEVCDTLIPPSAVNCGVLGSFTKLNTVLPPRVWAESRVESTRQIMNRRINTGYENRGKEGTRDKAQDPRYKVQDTRHKTQGTRRIKRNQSRVSPMRAQAPGSLFSQNETLYP